MITLVLLEFEVLFCLQLLFFDKLHCLGFMVLKLVIFVLNVKVSAVFGEFGDIIEVVLLRDKRTGLQQGMNQWFQL